MAVAGASFAVAASVMAPRPLMAEATAGSAMSLPARTPQLAVPLQMPVRRLLLVALGIVVGAVGLLAVLSAALSLVAGGGGASAATSDAYGPPVALREGSGLAGALEQGMAASQPGAYDMSLAAMVAAEDYQKFGVLRAMADIEAKRVAEAEAARAAQSAASPAPGTATSLGRASGYALGTVLSARLTIYGCTGPGGGFCGGMASGVKVFEGAAACSYDLPFGTRFRIQSDPTGRVYECLDRGHLASTWVDVFFYNTSEGIHWASLLSGTRVTIEIVN